MYTYAYMCMRAYVDTNKRETQRERQTATESEIVTAKERVEESERERPRERERERDRQTDRQTDRQADRQTDRQTETETDRVLGFYCPVNCTESPKGVQHTVLNPTVYFFIFFTTVLSQWNFPHGKPGLLSPGKASCDRVELPNLRYMLGVLAFP